DARNANSLWRDAACPIIRFATLTIAIRRTNPATPKSSRLLTFAPATRCSCNPVNRAPPPHVSGIRQGNIVRIRGIQTRNSDVAASGVALARRRANTVSPPVPQYSPTIVGSTLAGIQNFTDAVGY